MGSWLGDFEIAGIKTRSHDRNMQWGRRPVRDVLVGPTRCKRNSNCGLGQNRTTSGSTEPRPSFRASAVGPCHGSGDVSIDDLLIQISHLMTLVATCILYPE